MSDDHAILVDVNVPNAVLLDGSREDDTQMHPNTDGAVWYSANPACFTLGTDQEVRVWHPTEGLGQDATPVIPNEGHAKLAQDGGLHFETGLNAGLVIENALVEATAFSLAVRYHSPDGDARSLLTVNPPKHDTYLFLSEKDGVLSWQDQQDHALLSSPAPKGGGWAIAGYSDGALSLMNSAVGTAPGGLQQTALGADEIKVAMQDACDLFIGCRSHRKGIVKTLGRSDILDVLVWIDQDVTAQDPAVLHAVLRHCEGHRS